MLCLHWKEIKHNFTAKCNGSEPAVYQNKKYSKGDKTTVLKKLVSNKWKK